MDVGEDLTQDASEEEENDFSPASKDSDLGADVKVLAKPNMMYVAVRYALGVGAFLLLFALLTSAIVLVALAPPCNAVPKDGLVWWKTTVIYQCYPRSFKDTTGDGNGDIPGILEKIDYLHDLGVNAIWLNPIFKSPQRDNGYDISNYTDVDPLYGTMDDLKSLLDKIHSKGMHLILDFVPNHTSEKHPWFVESRRSKADPKRDWYVWANASDDGGLPNNWRSLFGGPAWTLDPTTGQYYLHQFSKFQPDLNFHNSEVKTAMENVIRFWFDFGVDGFRIDAVPYLLEDPELRNEPMNPDFNTSINCTAPSNNTACYGMLIHNRTKDYPGIHEIIKRWRNVSNNYTDRFFVGETFGPVETVVKYYGDNDEFHFPYNFLLLSNENWTGEGVSAEVSKWMDAMPEVAWPNWVLGNHDYPRITSKTGNYLARALNVLLLTLPGTSTTYYGEEIFMTDVHVPVDEQQDLYQDRDKERTPMQWTPGENAGFADKDVKPWLPLAKNYTTYNVQTESANSSSMWALYKRVVKMTTLNEAFRFAEYSPIMSNRDIFAYHRFHNGTEKEFMVVVNFSPSNKTANLSLMADSFESAKIELSSANTVRDGGKVDLSDIPLTGGEALIISGSNGTIAGSC